MRSGGGAGGAGRDRRIGGPDLDGTGGVAEARDDEGVEAERVEGGARADAPADLREVVGLDLGERLAPVLRGDRDEAVVGAGGAAQERVRGHERQRDGSL